MSTTVSWGSVAGLMKIVSWLQHPPVLSVSWLNCHTYDFVLFMSNTVAVMTIWYYDYNSTDQDKLWSVSIVSHIGVLFCVGGDSGSIILNSNEDVAVLLFAHDYANPIDGLSFAVDIQATIVDIECHILLRDMKLLT